MGRRVVRLNIERPAHAVCGLFMPPSGHCKQSQIEMNTGIPWIDRQGALVARYGFGGTSEAVKCIPRRHERSRKIGLDAEGNSVVVQGALVFAGAIVEVAQIE